MTGEGMEDFFSALEKAVVEYDEVYLPYVRKVAEERTLREEEEKLVKEEEIRRHIEETDGRNELPPSFSSQDPSKEYDNEMEFEEDRAAYEALRLKQMKLSD